ncbi:MAG: hypothetical protein ACI9W6_000021 [Motiliproteus sp.]|jgi:hypothetical protein
MDFKLKVIVSSNVYFITLDEQLSVIPAQTSAIYTLVDASGEPVVEALVLKRKGRNLEIEVDGEPVASIGDFYGPEGSATYSVDGALNPAGEMAVQGGESAVDNGIVWQASELTGAEGLSIQSGFVGAGVLALSAAVAAGGGGGGGGGSSTDTTAPTVIISNSIKKDTAANIDDGAITYTFTFSEPVTDFDASDVVVTNGEKSDFTSVDGGLEYSLVVTPKFDTGNSVTVAVDESVATDAAGNLNRAAVTRSQAFDIEAPGKATKASTAEDGPSISADEYDTGFIIVATLGGTNAVAGDSIELLLGDDPYTTLQTLELTQTDIDNNKVSFTLKKSDDADPDDLGNNGEKVFTTRVTDMAGNAGDPSTVLTVTLDTTAPTAAEAPSTAEDGPSISADEYDTGFTIVATLGGTNAVAGDSIELLLGEDPYTTLQTLELTQTDIDTNKVSFTLQKSADTDPDDLGDDGVKVFTTRVTDMAGNVGDPSTALTVTLDTEAPKVAIDSNTGKAMTSPADEADAIVLGSNIVLTFGEAINLGAGSIVIKSNRETITINVEDHGGQLAIDGNTLTIDLTDDLLHVDTRYDVRIDKDAVTDMAGNSYAGITDSNALNFVTEAVDTTTVVFDLVHGVNSDHNGGSGDDRHFESGVAYDIYIAVDSDNVALFTTKQSGTTGGAASDASWGTWTGAENLGDDDHIYYSGNGKQTWNEVDVAKNSTQQSVNLQATGSQVGQLVLDNVGNFTWKIGNESGKADLWKGTDTVSGTVGGKVANMRLDGVAQPFSQAMPESPVNILTTQGLT